MPCCKSARATGRKIRDFPVSPIRAALSPDGKQVAVGEIGTSLWDVATGQRYTTLDKNFVASLAFLDGTLLAVGGEKGVTLWNLTSGKKIRHLGHGAMVRSVVFPFGGKTVASAA